ncbi:MAG: glycerophosphoryl diester phosphodiesterase [Thermoproteota archaeon]|nr:glycerophosphoryl diester phosphodiesterase [Thermoproteota archaeon]
MTMVIITGHRGAGFLEPENTIRAMQRAIQLGVDQIEIDAHLTKDKKIAVIHDSSLDRTTNGHGFVGNYTLDELKQLDAGKGEKIPTLQEIIDVVRGKVTLQIELKELNVTDQVVKEVIENKLSEDVVVSSFWHQAVRRVKEINSKVKTGVLFTCSPIDVVQLARNAKADAIHPNVNYVNAVMVDEAHREGLTVRAWNADDEKLMIKILQMNVDALGSNRPDLLLKLLKTT